jgi:hypothetical protein
MTTLQIDILPGHYIYNDYSENQIIENNVLEQNDSRVSRNFEELIMERNGVQEDIDKSLYSHVFNEIKNKIFSMHEVENIPKLSETQREEMSKKYYTSEFNNTINRIKKLLVNNFNKKIELEITLNENKKKFEDFSKTINDLILYIHDAPNSSSQDEDESLKTLLSNRINWYYSNLDIDSLKKQHAEVLREYSFFKELFCSFSEVTPGGMCGICLDNQVTYFIDPCGHTICTTCKDKLRNNCHFCRARVNSIKRVYI